MSDEIKIEEEKNVIVFAIAKDLENFQLQQRELLQVCISFVLFLCSFIPLVGVIAPFAIFFTSAYFYGFAFIDYAIERKRFNVRQSVRYVNKNIGLVTGIGTVFALALMIPALSLAACCFVSLLSVIAGTIAVERMNDKSVK